MLLQQVEDPKRLFDRGTTLEFAGRLTQRPLQLLLRRLSGLLTGLTTGLLLALLLSRLLALLLALLLPLLLPLLLLALLLLALLSLLLSLLLALLFHSLNVLRIVIVDFFPGAVRNEKALTAGVVTLTLAAGIPGCFVILWPFIDGRIL